VERLKAKALSSSPKPQYYKKKKRRNEAKVTFVFQTELF
jgi:hypothetical protein